VKLNQEIIELRKTNKLLIEDHKLLQHEVILSRCRAFQKYVGIDQYYDQTVVYLFYLGIKDGNFMFKFGKSDTPKSRFKKHEKGFEMCELLSVRSCVNSLITERLIRKYIKQHNIRVDLEDKRGHNNTEIIECKTQKVLDDFLDYFSELTKFDVHITRLENLHKIALLDKDKTILKLQNLVSTFKNYITRMELTEKEKELKRNTEYNKDYPYWQKSCLYCDEEFLTDDMMKISCDNCKEVKRKEYASKTYTTEEISDYLRKQYTRSGE
jgi:hypothetical protein